MNHTRRHFLQATASTLLGLAARSAGAAEGLVASVTKEVLRAYGAPGGTWFHPRCCLVPGEKPQLLMTLQGISGSDFFGPVHSTVSGDLGRTWSEYVAVPPLGWEKLETGGHEAVCDVTPEYHAATQSVLALGHNVFYHTDRFHKDQPPRWPVYAVWKDGTWGPRRKLEWDDDPRGSYIYSNNCGQRVNLPDGDVMMSFTFGVKDKPRAVCGVRCSFDGHELKIKAVGPELTNAKGRGLLEPSLTRFDSKFYLTLRAEDERGYVAVSEDGLNYAPKKAWSWEDGTPLVMSTTQQHWLTHEKGLFLVYTRKDASNTGVMRWRAPLWMAEVDTKKLCLIRSSERVVLPLIGDGVNAGQKVAFNGNFGVANISPTESLITDGSWCPKDDNKGELALARVIWSTPNGLL